ncbi:hypothetical protein MTR67_037871, partial [Solanum verrucosum]
VPVDMVVNTTIAAMAKHGNLQNPQLNVYHVASSSINPLSFSQIFDYSYDFFKLFPFVNSKGDNFFFGTQITRSRYNLCPSGEHFVRTGLDSEGIEGGSKQHEVQDEKELRKIQIRLIKKKVEYLKNFSKLYEPYLFYKGWFDNGNVRKLTGDMSEEEKRGFEIDVTKINWRNYIEKTHFPGVQKYVLEGKKIN